MAKRIVIANQKGGVGKTTTAVNLSAALHQQGQRVLMVDFDPQANATSGLGVDKRSSSPNIYDVLVSGADPKRAVVKTQWCDVLPSHKSLAGAGIELIGMERREFLLDEVLNQLEQDYDYIIIDCPPSLELLTLNGLCAARSVIIPVQCEYYALEGLSDLTATLRIVKKRLNPELDIEGVLLTMYDGRTNLSIQVGEEVKRYFKKKVFYTLIPRNVRLSEAPSHGKPVIAYDRWSRGSEAYKALAKELIKRNAPAGASV
jgi:chromosome partitioning protein